MSRFSLAMVKSSYTVAGYICHLGSVLPEDVSTIGKFVTPLKKTPYMIQHKQVSKGVRTEQGV